MVTFAGDKWWYDKEGRTIWASSKSSGILDQDIAVLNPDPFENGNAAIISNAPAMYRALINLVYQETYDSSVTAILRREARELLEKIDREGENE